MPEVPTECSLLVPSRGSCPPPTPPAWAAASQGTCVRVAEGAGLPGPTLTSVGLDSVFLGSSFTVRVSLVV